MQCRRSNYLYAIVTIGISPPQDPWVGGSTPDGDPSGITIRQIAEKISTISLDGNDKLVEQLKDIFSQKE